MSLAVFTDSDATGGSWTAGTIVLGVSPAPVFTATNIFPGDTGSQTLTVANNGTGELRYAMTTRHDRQRRGPRRQAPAPRPRRHVRRPGRHARTTATSAPPPSATRRRATRAPTRSSHAGGTGSLCFTWSLDLNTTGNAYQGANATATFTFDAEQTANN